MGISVRSLQRVLAADGQTYKNVLEEVRCALAQSYLASGVPTLAEVAALLGYSDHTAFHRAFRRWTGVTPLEWRSRHAGGQPDGAQHARA
jgi:AraC-like DNA-binding protein